MWQCTSHIRGRPCAGSARACADVVNAAAKSLRVSTASEYYMHYESRRSRTLSNCEDYDCDLTRSWGWAVYPQRYAPSLNLCSRRDFCRAFVCGTQEARSAEGDAYRPSFQPRHSREWHVVHRGPN